MAQNGAGSGNANGGIVPTNSVSTGNGSNIKARIDPSLTVAEVVKQLCVNLQMKRPASDFALRDEQDELVTDQNLRRKIKTKARLKLVNAPHVEAQETVEKLQNTGENARLVLFNLQRLIKEDAFCESFLSRGGLHLLVEHIHISHGNTLAYALSALQNLIQRDDGWALLDGALIARVVDVLQQPSSLVNVCRPATAILKRLVEADPSAQPGPLLASSSRGPPPPPPGSVYRFGFDAVYEHLYRAPNALDTIVSRIGTADTQLALHSIMLVTALLTHATDAHWDALTARLDALGTARAVVRLMTSHMIDDLRSTVLDFQSALARVFYRNKSTYVQPDSEPAHAAACRAVLAAARVDSWVDLGFASNDPAREFGEVGVLGLYCLRNLALDDADAFARATAEQLGRPPSRRCPLARASNEIVELLSEHWAIFAPGYATSPSFQPFFLNFYKIHTLAFAFFLRIWDEAGAAQHDFQRVVALVRSQVKLALRGESTREWHEMEDDFRGAGAEYRLVRERQMKELEEEDDLLSKVPIRNLREKLTRESKEFVRQQRLHCLTTGAWFSLGVPISSPHPRRPARPYRFLRLDRGMKYLHYVDATSKFPVRDGLEDLPERIELSLVSEIALGQCALPPSDSASNGTMHKASFASSPVGGTLRNNRRSGQGNGGSGGGGLGASPLSFSLMTSEGSAADLVAPDAARWADWTDGLNMLRRDGGHVGSEMTAGFVQALTEIGLKIKLLDLSGDKVEIPSGLSAGAPPVNADFYFSDFYDPQ
ncbi:hypothetical protein PENSPDRAFT_674197 [Peniophora sp. CONT]|nr:hypothetical protein PENSPDRAFT_674197 [Peniophora sp. CONT]